MRIDGKVVLITGASEGIGAACAAEFARYGAKLSLTARNEAGLAQAGGGQALLTAADLTRLCPDQLPAKCHRRFASERYSTIAPVRDHAGGVRHCHPPRRGARRAHCISASLGLASGGAVPPLPRRGAAPHGGHDGAG